VKPARFEYVRPETVPATLELLASHGGDAAILAGGQSLVPMLNFRIARPHMLIDVNRIGGLDRIEVQDGALIIGARARHSEVLRSQLVHSHAPLLREGLKHVAHAAIRNRGTLGGSLALADPAAELPPASFASTQKSRLRRDGRSARLQRRTFSRAFTPRLAPLTSCYCTCVFVPSIRNGVSASAKWRDDTEISRWRVLLSRCDWLGSASMTAESLFVE
jgi:xanthine dehydrogenase iron-sulfur cluster and FAD-binding subunit A